MNVKLKHNRLTKRFDQCKSENRSALIVYITASDPDCATSTALMHQLPEAGADIIKLGMPFTDPVADSPSLQKSALRALDAGGNMKWTLDQVRNFRSIDDETPIVLTGYFNPIDSYGVDTFAKDAAQAGVDGIIVMDVPPEEAGEIHPYLEANGIAFVMLATSTSDNARLPIILKHAGGFLYYVSPLDHTGSHSEEVDTVDAVIKRVRSHKDLPVAVGFGSKSPNNILDFARIADAVVVDSDIINHLETGLDTQGKATGKLIPNVRKFVSELAKEIRTARQ